MGLKEGPLRRRVLVDAGNEEEGAKGPGGIAVYINIGPRSINLHKHDDIPLCVPYFFSSSAVALSKNASITKACVHLPHIPSLIISLPLMFRHLTRRVVASVVSFSRTQKYFIICLLFNILNRENA